MEAEHLENLLGVAAREAVGTEGEDRLIPEGLGEHGLVVHEIGPLVPLEPRGVPRQPKPFVPVLDGSVSALRPAGDHFWRVQIARTLVPCVNIPQLELPDRFAGLQVVHLAGEGIAGTGHPHALGDHPDTPLVGFETDPKERDEDLEELFRGLVEMTDVGTLTPGFNPRDPNGPSGHGPSSGQSS